MHAGLLYHRAVDKMSKGVKVPGQHVSWRKFETSIGHELAGKVVQDMAQWTSQRWIKRHVVFGAGVGESPAKMQISEKVFLLSGPRIIGIIGWHLVGLHSELPSEGKI